ncbi:hypothetical protein D3C74_349380 [compost metagenome]
MNIDVLQTHQISEVFGGQRGCIVAVKIGVIRTNVLQLIEVDISIAGKHLCPGFLDVLRSQYRIDRKSISGVFRIIFAQHRVRSDGTIHG